MAGSALPHPGRPPLGLAGLAQELPTITPVGKPALLGGPYLNVLYGDSHVKRHASPPDTVQQLLAQADISAPAPRAITATTAVVEREMGYQKVAGLMLGKALAAKHPKARVLIVDGPHAAGTREQPLVSGLKEGLQGLEVVATIPAQIPAGAQKVFAAREPATPQGANSMPPLEYWFTAGMLNELTSSHAGKVDLVISTISLPQDAEAGLWFWKDNVKVAIANGSIYDLRGAIQDGRITAAVTYNPKATYDALPLPADPAAAFARRYLLITPETVAQIATEYSHLFRR